MNDDRKIRAFIAIKTPPEWDAELGQLQERFKKSAAGKSMKWVNPEQIHITLRFLGWILPPQINAVTEAMNGFCAGMPPFELHSTGLGCFPSSRRPRVIWVGLAGDLSPLAELHRRITEATCEIGEAPEDRPFTPHLTLARIKQVNRSEQAAIEQWLKTPFAVKSAWRISEIVLMRSHLAPQGARYEKLESVQLKE